MKRGLLIAIAALVVGAGVWFWKTRGATRATQPTPQENGSAASRAGAGGRAGGAAGGARDEALASAIVRVSSAQGPIANASVRFAPADGELLVIATDAQGIARADKLPAGAWKISASAQGFAPNGLAPRSLAAGEKVDLAITLVAGGVSLTGTVSDISGGPVAGARVDAAKLGAKVRPGVEVATTFTDKDGAYTLTVSEGQLLVAASSPEYGSQARYVEVGAGGATADFALVPGAVIEGVVRDEQTKQPIAGARVIAAREGGVRIGLADRSRQRVTTGADGKFRFTGLAPGAYELSARSDTKTTRAPTVIGLGVAEQVADVELLLGRAVIVSGVVKDDAGTPVAGVRVHAGGPGGDDAEELSGADGAFMLVGVPPGKYALYGSSDEYVADKITRIEVVDKDVTGVVVTVRKGRTLAGHVEPRQKCRIAYDLAESAFGARMPTIVAAEDTDANGEFSLGPASAAKATLTARCESGDMGSVAVPEGGDSRPLVIEVSGAASIAGTLRDTKGQPIAGATVMAAPDRDERKIELVNGVVTSGVQALTSSTGAFEIKGLAAGSYRLTALEVGRPLRPRSPVSVQLADKEKKTGVELVVDRADGVISGVVTGPDGAPIADAWVSVHLATDTIVEALLGDERGEPGSRSVTVTSSSDSESGNASETAPVLTDAAGRFSIGGLIQMKYLVIAEAQGGALRGRVADVVPSKQITIAALGVTSLSGTVKSASGPATVFDVELEGPTSARRTFTGGAFALGRVDPGAYTIRVTSPHGNAELKVDVLPGQAKTVDIVLTANAVITGQVVDADGKPLTEVGIVVVKDEGEGRTRVSLSGPPPTTGPDGTFRVEAPAQPSALVVMTRPRPLIRRPLALAAGQTLDLGVIRAEPGPALPP